MIGSLSKGQRIQLVMLSGVIPARIVQVFNFMATEVATVAEIVMVGSAFVRYGFH